MKRVILRYGIGYGTHETDFEVDDDATEAEIEEMAQDVALERFDWSYRIEGPSVPIEGGG